MRSDRLLAMLLLLQTRSPISATELSERLEVSVRTVYRDAEALSSAGVPVYAERGRAGGIALLPGYRTQVPGLSADETRSLFVALTGAPHADLGLGDALGSALRKVMASLPEAHRDAASLVATRVLVDPDRWGAPDPRPEHLDVVQAAVLDERRLRVRYRSGGGAERSYALDPLGMISKAGTWYLVAAHRKTLKTFRIDRMRHAAILDAPARRPAAFDLADTWSALQRDYATSLSAVSVSLRVRRRILPRVLRMHGGGTPAPAADGPPDEWVELTLRFPRIEAAQALLAHADGVEVLEPSELRDRFADLGRRVTQLYSVP
ncbi:helix-turn-helix transcriptional regulator [Microbacterium sp. NPDC077663]|uniref:helix-turn-helix transcriptional regulator n=1 Tax=Microbacterium sp. NPDC077663 TaxID=3364189 RepID=UPI0037C6DC54